MSDDRFMRLLIDEANQQLAIMTAAVEALNSGAEDEECRRALIRAIRKLKAAAVSVGELGLMDVVETLESLVVSLRERPGPANGVEIATMRESLDLLRRLVHDVGAPRVDLRNVPD